MVIRVAIDIPFLFLVEGVEEVEGVEVNLFLTTPLLARRGAETDERSESGEPACRQAGRGGRSFF
jgi:hypothetical protein